MYHTKIQWCHSTINPVMGCSGCELWPSPAKIKADMVASITSRQQAEPKSETRTSQIPAKHNQTTSEKT
jgi:protein gp37